MSVKSDHKLILKNTIALYFRMGLSMLVGLYTSRVILEQLGISDFGVYSVVGGLISLFSFLNVGMSQATLRFLNMDLGTNKLAQVNHTFSMSLNVHFCIAVLVLVLAETIGLWLVNTKLNLPDGRMYAANWVYQLSIAGTLITIVCVPYTSMIIAQERMAFFAVIGLIDSGVKLLCVWVLSYINVDKLFLYPVLVLLALIMTQAVRIIYCGYHFGKLVHYRFSKDLPLFQRLISFSGWSLFGNASDMCNFHGINIAMNFFGGVVINAALGIAHQVNAALYGFVANFQMAFKPQLFQLYAAKQQKQFIELVFYASKISFYLMFFLAFPLCLNIDWVLKIWLKNVPEYSAAFAICIIAYSIIDAIAGPLWLSIQANGNIKKYQIIISLFFFASLPLCIILLWLGFSPVTVMAARTGINLCALIWRIFFLRRRVGLPARRYLIEVCLRLFCVSVSAAVLPVCALYLLWDADGLYRFLVTGVLSAISIPLAIWLLGLTKWERQQCITTFFNKLNIKKKVV